MPAFYIQMFSIYRERRQALHTAPASAHLLVREMVIPHGCLFSIHSPSHTCDALGNNGELTRGLFGLLTPVLSLKLPVVMQGWAEEKIKLNIFLAAGDCFRLWENLMLKFLIYLASNSFILYIFNPKLHKLNRSVSNWTSKANGRRPARVFTTLDTFPTSQLVKHSGGSILAWECFSFENVRYTSLF